MTQIFDLPLKHNRADVLRYLGFLPGKTELSPQVMDLLLSAQGEFGTLAEAKGVYRSGSLSDLSLDDYWGSVDLEILLGEASRATLLATTVGEAVDDEISRLFAAGRYAEGALWDALGSDAAEQAMETLAERAEAEILAAGYLPTRRFSPGYGDVDLARQEQLCSLVGAHSIGIQLTPQFLLMPRKSVTALIGWVAPGCTAAPAVREAGCAACGFVNCAFRGTRTR